MIRTMPRRPGFRRPAYAGGRDALAETSREGQPGFNVNDAATEG